MMRASGGQFRSSPELATSAAQQWKPQAMQQAGLAQRAPALRQGCDEKQIGDARLDPASRRVLRRRMDRIVRRAGFTLIEVLAAITLLLIVLPVAMQGVSTAMRAGGTAGHLSDVAMLGHDKLMDLVVTGDYQTANLSGEFGDDWKGYRWSLKVDEYNDSMDQVTVTVYWTEQGREQKRDFTTLVTIDSSSE